MQIYNHFICWCLPPFRMVSRTYLKIMLPRCLPQNSRHHRPPLNLPASQNSAGWRLMSLWAPWLQLHSVHACVSVYAMCVHIPCRGYIHDSKKSLLDGYKAEKKKSLPPFHLTCSRLSFVWWWAFGLQGISVCLRDVSPNIVVYHTSGWKDRKKMKGRRKEPVFHPISFERQCCALVIE